MSGSESGSSESWKSGQSLEDYDSFRTEYLNFPRTTAIIDNPPFPVARHGPAIGNRMLARTDISAVYRLDTRPPWVIMAEGFKAWNDINPPSLQAYQREERETSWISTTRDKNSRIFDYDRVVENNRMDAAGNLVEPVVYQYKIYMRGGVDVMASLNLAAFSNQQEVIFPREIPAANIWKAWRIGPGGAELETFVNPRAHAAAAIRDELHRQERAYSAASTSSIVPTGSKRRRSDRKDKHGASRDHGHSRGGSGHGRGGGSGYGGGPSHGGGIAL